MATSRLNLPEFNRDEKMTAQECAYARLHHALMVGSIAPGVPITIRGLAQAMDVSPTPVREALRRLSSKNAVAVLENRRIVVPQMTRRRFRELVSLRTAIELYAAERALPFISEALIDGFQEIDTQMDKAVKDQDRIKLIVLNQQFHDGIYSANENQVSMPMIESIWLQLGPFMRVALQHIGTFYTIDRHKEIIQALRQRDLAALKTAIEADIHDAVGHFDDDALDKIIGPRATSG